jgi:cellulose synthase (UDP-forming)
MQVLRLENPAFVSGLRPMQRVSYVATLLGWFEAWRTLGYLVLPMVVVLTGAVPVRASMTAFLAFFVPAFVLQRWALHLLARGMAPQGISTVFDLVRMPANLRATLRLVSTRSQGFTVTSKGRTGADRARVRLPRLHTVLVLASVLSALWFVATTAGLTPTTYDVPWAANGAAMWLAANSVLLAAAVRRIRLERYGSERRQAVRFPVQGHALIGGVPGRLLDASLTGFRAVLPAPLAVETCEITVDVGSGPVDVQCLVRSQVTSVPGSASTETVVGLEAVPGQVAAQAVLARALLQTAGVAVLPTTLTSALPVQRPPVSPSRRSAVVGRQPQAS